MEEKKDIEEQLRSDTMKEKKDIEEQLEIMSDSFQGAMKEVLKQKEEKEQYFECVQEIAEYMTSMENNFSPEEKYGVFNIIEKYDEKLALDIKADVRN